MVIVSKINTTMMPVDFMTKSQVALEGKGRSGKRASPTSRTPSTTPSTNDYHNPQCTHNYIYNNDNRA